MSNEHVHPIFQPILSGIAPTLCDVCGREKPCTEDEVTGDMVCDSCRQNEAEAAYERSQEEPCFRGREWAAAQAAEADWIRRHLK